MTRILWLFTVVLGQRLALGPVLSARRLCALQV